jgi:UDP-2,3-diacylglucosamine pyrophosphatase LpxH
VGYTILNYPPLKLREAVLPSIVNNKNLKNVETIQTTDVMIVKSKNSDNFYFRHGNGIIVVPPNIAGKWDTIDSVNIDEVHYEKQKNQETGVLEDKPWSRMEVVGLNSTEVKLAKATRNLQLKEQYQVAATKFVKAKNEALKVTDLSAELKAELTELLNF